MEKREALTEAAKSIELQAKVEALLDDYLYEFGLSSKVTRGCWIKRVIDDLATLADPVASEDILEQAVEYMRDLIEARVAMVCCRNQAREHKEIAQTMLLLLKDKYADCRQKLFECSEPDLDLETLEHVRQTLTASSPIPVPPLMPLIVPVQTIELRSLNPLRWLFRRS
jgi:hypothetical protein